MNSTWNLQIMKPADVWLKWLSLWLTTVNQCSAANGPTRLNCTLTVMVSFSWQINIVVHLPRTQTLLKIWHARIQKHAFFRREPGHACQVYFPGGARGTLARYLVWFFISYYVNLRNTNFSNYTPYPSRSAYVWPLSNKELTK